MITSLRTRSGDKMRLAVVGTGIAGNAAAYALSTSTSHEITVFDKETRAGGHSATVDIDYDGKKLSVDTGFIVYNETNYPLLTSLFDHLGVETEFSNMSFSLSADHGRFEWCGRAKNPVSGLFAQRSNLFSPGYLKMLFEILRFNRTALDDLKADRLDELSLGDYLERHRFSLKFRTDYLLPMGAAIWSMSTQSMLNFPARSFIAFFNNHHLLGFVGPEWRTVRGGSRSYVKKMIAAYQDRLRLGVGVTSVERHVDFVRLSLSDGTAENFDGVIFASHTDETLAILGDQATAEERTLLGSIPYKPNKVYLHRDPRFMPRRKRAWAAWNVLQEKGQSDNLCVTYWMNMLQNLDHSRPVFVTLNPQTPPADKDVFGCYTYDHPQFDAAAIAAQPKLGSLQGKNRTWFAGAWTRYGFHEDGLMSGLDVAAHFGAMPEWAAVPRLAAAAE
ncbi:MAG: FAD-dependent oxidoreductase [Alphaproteobacteria bacterium]